MVQQATAPAKDLSMVRKTAEVISSAFAEYHWVFEAITRRAKRRFEACDWHGMHDDASERLDLYKDYVERTVRAIKAQDGPEHEQKAFWEAVKSAFTEMVAERDDAEIAQSFYNSVTMRVFGVHRLDPDIQYTGTEIEPRTLGAEDRVYRAYEKRTSTADVVKQMLADCDFACGFEALKRDAARTAGEIDSYMEAELAGQALKSIEVAEAVFYRGKIAYLAGRICTDSHATPLVIAIMNGPEGVWVDAVLLTEDEVSIVFSFTRSYFHVEVESPRALVRFLKTIMPLKPVAELYISLGYNKHGKTELYRGLVRYLERSPDRFQMARGERGMVMVVFTLPGYDVVFKIIKDTFDYPKRTTRQEVRNRYYLVFKHDRGGRLVDAQEFEDLRFPRDRFADDLLAELLDVASHTVRVEGDEVVIEHLYTERRLVPLNLYVHEVDHEAAVDAVIDYGQAIKDLAATNIFPGDLLLKNFGVTRHGRVVFYDYDELCLLSECNFREMPQAKDAEEDLMADPWFSVDEADVFPEELDTFLGLPAELREVFVEHHGDLFGVGFWRDLQRRHAHGEIIEIFPYPERKRLLVASG